MTKVLNSKGTGYVLFRVKRERVDPYLFLPQEFVRPLSPKKIWDNILSILANQPLPQGFQEFLRGIANFSYLERLNRLLELPDLYGVFRGIINFKSLPQELKRDFLKTEEWNKQDLPFSEVRQRTIRKANRRLIETLCPQGCPRTRRDWRTRYHEKESDRTRVEHTISASRDITGELPDGQKVTLAKDYTYVEYSGFVNIPIPAAFQPAPAVVEPFSSLEQAFKRIRSFWGSEQDFRRLVGNFKALLKKHSSLDKRHIKYGTFGLYTLEGRKQKPKLQSVHCLLPGSLKGEHPPTSIVALYLKAPWNRFDFSTSEGFHGQHWGLSVAILVHAIRIYYHLRRISIDEQEIEPSEAKVAAWRFGAVTLKERVIDFGSVLSGAIPTIKDLFWDLFTFGIKLEEETPFPLGEIDHEEFSYGAGLIQAGMARQIIDQYNFWQRQMFSL